jgi:hypothetical protein
MWNQLCHPLQKRSKQYRDRCSAREPTGLPGDKYFKPKFFPPLPETFAAPLGVLELPPDLNDDQDLVSLLPITFNDY